MIQGCGTEHKSEQNFTKGNHLEQSLEKDRSVACFPY